MGAFFAHDAARAQSTGEPLTASDAAASDPTIELEGLKQRAQALVTAGYRYAHQGDFASALERFEAAYDLYQSPKILLNIGTSVRQLGRNAEAAAAYASYLHHPDSDPARRGEVEGLLSDIEQRVGKVRLLNRIPRVWFSIDAQPPPFTDADGWIWVEPGAHIALAANNRRERTRRFTIAAGERMTLNMSFEEPKIEIETRIQTIERTTNTGQRTAGILLGATGLAGMVAGAIAALAALAADGQADEHCDVAGGHPEFCDAEGVELGITAKERATAAAATVGAGAAVLSVGVVLFITASGESEPRLEPRAGRMQLGVRW